jgi:hypothetical protein
VLAEVVVEQQLMARKGSPFLRAMRNAGYVAAKAANLSLNGSVMAAISSGLTTSSKAGEPEISVL